MRHTVIAILHPAYAPSAKMRSMNGNSRRARHSKWEAPSPSSPYNHPNWRDGVRIGPVDEDPSPGS